MNKLIAHSLLFVTVLSLGCSNIRRTADAGISPDEVFSELNNLGSGTSGFGGSSSQAQEIVQMAQMSDATTYYSAGPGPMGPVVSVAALVDFSDFGLQGVTTDQISSVVVFFVDAPSSPNRAGLLVSITANGQTSTAAFVGNAEISKDDYTASVSGTGNLTLQSNDSDGSLLNGAIQLNVHGSAGYIGKFSTLAGFSH